MHSQEQFKTIQEIQQLLADSRKEYAAASHRVPELRVRQLLSDLAREREQMEEDLAQDLRQHDPARKTGSGTIGGTVHRALLIFRDTINNTSEVNVLVEMERQEADLLGYYNKVLKTADLDEFSRAMLTRQHGEIERNVAKVHELRREMETVHS